MSVTFYRDAISVFYNVSRQSGVFSGTLRKRKRRKQTAVKKVIKYNNIIVYYIILFIHIYRHHHVVPLAQIYLILSRHFSLSPIASGRSSGLHPVSSHSCCMYVRAGRPAFAWPYAGVHRSTSFVYVSVCLCVSVCANEQLELGVDLYPCQKLKRD